MSEILSFIRTDGHGYIDSACRPDKEYLYFWSVTPRSACYILF